MEPGIHLFHKPIGATSFSLVRRCMEQAALARPGKRPRLCHGGTLDPFADGLLLILSGHATRLFDHLHDIPKTYVAEFHWGEETDTGDGGGKVIFTGDPGALTASAVERAAAAFEGVQMQIPPATSARRVDGERAYEKALRGEAVELPPAQTYLHEWTWLSHDLPRRSVARIIVRGGFYVRSLARDLGRALGCGARLQTLRRESIGPWRDPAQRAPSTIRGEALLPWLPRRTLDDRELGELRRERPIEAGVIGPAEWPLPAGFGGAAPLIRALHQGRLMALLQRSGARLVGHTSFPGGL